MLFHKPTVYNLIGQLNHFDIDEHCEVAEAGQPKNVTFKTWFWFWFMNSADAFIQTGFNCI